MQFVAMLSIFCWCLMMVVACSAIWQLFVGFVVPQCLRKQRDIKASVNGCNGVSNRMLL